MLWTAALRLSKLTRCVRFRSDRSDGRGTTDTADGGAEEEGRERKGSRWTPAGLAFAFNQSLESVARYGLAFSDFLNK